jgi:hypothetical protein
MKPGAELKVSVATLLLNEPVVIVGTLDWITSETVISFVVPSVFVAVYAQLVIAPEAILTLVFENEIVLPLTTVIAEAALL